MLQGLRTVVYMVNDLQAAKKWYSEVFGIQPYFDEVFYVGFNVGGYELGLHPADASIKTGDSAVSYWGVADIEASMKALLDKGVKLHQQVEEVGGDIKVASVFDPFGNIVGLIENPHFGH